MTKKIILFASGNGSNVENICQFFEQDADVDVLAVYSNNPKAGVIQRLQPYGLAVTVFDKTDFTNGTLLKQIQKKQPDLIVLAGFLWKIGLDWVLTFPNKIINIHPALLPKYGGKGMYGQHVHQAVKDNKETETGITIHFVNEAYDQGTILFQEKVALNPEDTQEEIAAKVHQLEYLHFPEVISNLIKQKTP